MNKKKSFKLNNNNKLYLCRNFLPKVRNGKLGLTNTVLFLRKYHNFKYTEIGFGDEVQEVFGCNKLI